jgi:hypothetical protein
MKLSSLLVAGILVAASVVISAPISKADGLPDPNVTIGKGFHSVQETDGATDTDPLIITDDSGVTDVQYEGQDTSTFYVELIPFDGESLSFFESEGFTCTIGAGATGCKTAPTCNSNLNEICPSPSLPAVEFVFFATDSKGAPENFIFNGDHLLITTPEPGGLALLVMGLITVVMFGLRRRVGNLA